ncbi:hypothetical protein H6G06_11125 [Anabaena sphaerica FACHB-251]|uniref:DUF1574 domain-containing protein n=1 Tax=Anabaena sphaerica FACHB-251 TaxID=2692883 RepID=A0A926WIW1_9NOST|nr:hypothetical protein [Anabaena sphaerica]MBD2294028.1 hypothetical protein [Anabaena sphaerica FACHB-251]
MSNNYGLDLTNISNKQMSKSDNFFQFNKWFFSTIAIFILMVVSFNALIDPYGIYKSPIFVGINHVKPQKKFNDRLVKAIEIIHTKPFTIFLGSSRTKQGLDPNHLALSNFKPVYNIGLDGSNPYELLRYLQHTIKNQPHLKQVILGVDFFMFNESLGNQPGFDENRLEKTYIIPNDIINSLFSLDVLQINRETILASLQNNHPAETSEENGYVPNYKYEKKPITFRFRHFINSYFVLHYQYKFSDKYFDYFRQIINLCQERNIKLIVFISPSHATQWEAIRVTGQWPTFESWKEKIVQLSPVWDFSGYNSITTEAINDMMVNYVDNSHYTTRVGNLLINRIFGYKENELPADFGILVNKDNIEYHLAKIRADREEWLKKHKDEFDLVQSLEKQFLAAQQDKNSKQ